MKVLPKCDHTFIIFDSLWCRCFVLRWNTKGNCYKILCWNQADYSFTFKMSCGKGYSHSLRLNACGHMLEHFWSESICNWNYQQIQKYLKKKSSFLFHSPRHLFSIKMSLYYTLAWHFIMINLIPQTVSHATYKFDGILIWKWVKPVNILETVHQQRGLLVYPNNNVAIKRITFSNCNYMP